MWICGIFGVLPGRHPPRQLGGFNGLDGLERREDLEEVCVPVASALALEA